MEQTLTKFFAAVNANDVDQALACCDAEVECRYPDPGRNWQGQESGRVVMTAIFGQLGRIAAKASFEIVAMSEEANTVQTRESWGHPNRKTTTTYTFTQDNKILRMES